MPKLDTGDNSCPWVGIIIVNYNAGLLIQACVDALAAQTFADFEAVVVDNASTDGSADSLRVPRSAASLRNSYPGAYITADHLEQLIDRGYAKAELGRDLCNVPDKRGQYT